MPLVQIQDFTVVDFYDYKIRSVNINNTLMYAASDLLSQYNKINNCDKRMNNYLRNQQTIDLLRSKVKNPECADSCIQRLDKKYLNNPDIIIEATYTSSGHGGSTCGYLMCEQLLIAFLMWLDPKFAWDIYTFLMQCRQEDNNFLKDRLVPDEEMQQWTFAVVKTTDYKRNVMYRLKYLKTKNVTRKLINSSIYILNDIPNGYTFKIKAFETLFPIIRRYFGVAVGCHKSLFTISGDIVDIEDTTLDAKIRIALKNLRQHLDWRPDLDTEIINNNIEA
mgnify:CR=1 FL=1